MKNLLVISNSILIFVFTRVSNITHLIVPREVTNSPSQKVGQEEDLQQEIGKQIAPIFACQPINSGFHIDVFAQTALPQIYKINSFALISKPPCEYHKIRESSPPETTRNLLDKHLASNSVCSL